MALVNPIGCAWNVGAPMLVVRANGQQLEQISGLASLPGDIGIIALNGAAAGTTQLDFDDLVIELPIGVKPPATPDPRPGGEKPQRILLPLVARAAALTMAATPAPSVIHITTGMGLGADGNLIQPGTAFQVGVTSLAAVVSYSDLPVGLPIHWIWLKDGAMLPGEGLSGQDTAKGGSGQFGLLIGTADRRPMPVGRYSIRVWRTAHRL